MFEELKKMIESMPKPICKNCNKTGGFKKVGECYNEYDSRNNLIMMDLVQCSFCDEIYSEKEYNKLEKVTY